MIGNDGWDYLHIFYQHETQVGIYVVLVKRSKGLFLDVRKV